MSSIRRYWILTLLGGSLVGVLLSTPVDRFFLADGSNNTSYRLSVVWGVVWGATALLTLITTTAFRSLLQLQAEMILAMYSTGSALLLALGMWHTRSMSITLGISLGSILLGVAIAEMLFSHFGKKVRLTSTQENAKL